MKIMDDSPDSQKWQQHLTLLREQYVNLYNNYTKLQQKYAQLSATKDDNSYVGKLLSKVGSLYGDKKYSDLTVAFNNQESPAHKFVLTARSNYWNNVAENSVLDWRDLDNNVGPVLLKWIYTDGVTQDQLSLELMRAAAKFELKELVDRCEKFLIGTVRLEDCVKYYTVAEELGTEKLRNHCSSLISSHWEDLSGEDFKEMPGQLLYQLLKTKSDYPLHSAVRLQREDVVFLYLAEHNAELPDAVNVVDQKGETALEVALRSRQPQLARTLVEHRADLSAKDNRGLSLLHSSIVKGDSYSAEFIVEQLEKPTGPCSPKLSEIVADNGPEGCEGCSALHLLATSRGTDMLAVVSRLLRAGVDPNHQNRKGLTVLQTCVLEENLPMIDLLINEAKGLDLERRTREGETALGLALRLEGEPGPIAKRLLEAEAEPNPTYPNSNGDRLLHRLAREGREEAALFLLERNPKSAENGSLLHEACRTGLERLVRQLLKNAPNHVINSENKNTETALHLAVASGRLGLVKALIESTDKSELSNFLEAKNKDGETPLTLAIAQRSGSQESANEILAALIAAGANVDQRNELGQTLLHHAILREDSATAIFLLEHGADINAKTETGGETPLQLCVHCRMTDVVDALCRRGADILTGCPIWDALDTDQQDIASILVTHGADTDCWNSGPEGCLQTLLHRAIDENKEEIAQFLIRSGCDLNAARKPGPDGGGGDLARDECTPLHLCCQWGLEQVVQTLIEHGANVNARDAESKTPVHIAIQNQHAQIISLLLCHPNINLSIRDKKGQSPFATALNVRNNKAAEAILSRLPTAAEQFDNKGRNFLHTAIQKNDMESILFLLSIQVDVNSKVQDVTQIPPLHLAAVSGTEMLVRSLILAGARVNDTDAHRNTALHAAAKAGQATVVSALLQNNINFDAVNADGDNALHVAVREGHVAVVRTLLTECTLDAEAVNLKGRNPLHELARYGRDNAAIICELFFECMAKYPLNNTDTDGNTPLLIAYMKGNGNLCRTLVKAGACLGSMNKDGITIFNYQVATKQLLYRLLESLTEEAPWADKDHCLECGTKFTLTMRKHHCRHCGRILCSKCSGQDVPILKFGQNKPVRVCAVCFDVLQVGAD